MTTPASLAPHVEDDATLASACARRDRARMQQLIDVLPVPIALLSAERLWMAENRAARTALAQCFTRRGGRVCGFSWPAGESFARQFGRALRGETCDTLLRDPERGAHCWVRMAPVAAPLWLGTPWARACVLATTAAVMNDGDGHCALPRAPPAAIRRPP